MKRWTRQKVEGIIYYYLQKEATKIEFVGVEF